MSIVALIDTHAIKYKILLSSEYLITFFYNFFLETFSSFVKI